MTYYKYTSVVFINKSDYGLNTESGRLIIFLINL